MTPGQSGRPLRLEEHVLEMTFRTLTFEYAEVDDVLRLLVLVFEYSLCTNSMFE